jgi:putative membrane protein
MTKFILHFIGLALIIYYLLPYFVDGIAVNTYVAAIIATLLFIIINIIIKPIIKIVTLPLNIATLGIFGFVVNVLLFWFVATLISGFVVTDFTAALLGALVLTLANWILERLLR